MFEEGDRGSLRGRKGPEDRRIYSLRDNRIMMVKKIPLSACSLLTLPDSVTVSHLILTKTPPPG